MRIRFTFEICSKSSRYIRAHTHRGLKAAKIDYILSKKNQRQNNIINIIAAIRATTTTKRFIEATVDRVYIVSLLPIACCAGLLFYFTFSVHF